MSNCISACKQIVMLCEEARMRGKSVIRIKKIMSIADNAVRADMEEENSNTETGCNEPDKEETT